MAPKIQIRLRPDAQNSKRRLGLRFLSDAIGSGSALGYPDLNFRQPKDKTVGRLLTIWAASQKPQYAQALCDAGISLVDGIVDNELVKDLLNANTRETKKGELEHFIGRLQSYSLTGKQEYGVLRPIEHRGMTIGYVVISIKRGEKDSSETLYDTSISGQKQMAKQGIGPTDFDSLKRRWSVLNRLGRENKNEGSNKNKERWKLAKSSPSIVTHECTATDGMTLSVSQERIKHEDIEIVLDNALGPSPSDTQKIIREIVSWFTTHKRLILFYRTHLGNVCVPLPLLHPSNSGSTTTAEHWNLALRSLLDGLDARGPMPIFIMGGPSTGKTTLIRHLAYQMVTTSNEVPLLLTCKSSDSSAISDLAEWVTERLSPFGYEGENALRPLLDKREAEELLKLPSTVLLIDDLDQLKFEDATALLANMFSLRDSGQYQFRTIVACSQRLRQAVATLFLKEADTNGSSGLTGLDRTRDLELSSNFGIGEWAELFQNIVCTRLGGKRADGTRAKRDFEKRVGESSRLKTMLTLRLLLDLAEEWVREKRLDRRLVAILLNSFDESVARLECRIQKKLVSQVAGNLRRGLERFCFRFLLEQASDEFDLAPGQRSVTRENAKQHLIDHRDISGDLAEHQESLLNELLSIGLLRASGHGDTQRVEFQYIGVAEAVAARYLRNSLGTNGKTMDDLLDWLFESLSKPIFQTTIGLLVELMASDKNTSFFEAFQRKLPSYLCPSKEPEGKESASSDASKSVPPVDGPQIFYQRLVLLRLIGRGLELRLPQIKSLIALCRKEATLWFSQVSVEREVKRITAMSSYKDAIEVFKKNAPDFVSLSLQDGVVLKYLIFEGLRRRQPWLRDERILAKVCISLLKHLVRIEEDSDGIVDKVARDLGNTDGHYRFIVEVEGRPLESVCIGHQRLLRALECCLTSSWHIGGLTDTQALELLDGLESEETISLLAQYRYAGLAKPEYQNVHRAIADLFSSLLREAEKDLYSPPNNGGAARPTPIKELSMDSYILLLKEFTQWMGFFCSPSSLTTRYRDHAKEPPDGGNIEAANQIFHNARKDLASLWAGMNVKQEWTQVEHPTDATNVLRAACIQATMGVVIARFRAREISNTDKSKDDTIDIKHAACLMADRIGNRHMKDHLYENSLGVQGIPSAMDHSLVILFGLLAVSVTSQSPSREWDGWLRLRHHDVADSHWLTRFILGLTQFILVKSNQSNAIELMERSVDGCESNENKRAFAAILADLKKTIIRS